MNKEETMAAPPASAAASVNLRFPVLITDSRPPFPELAVFKLDAVPRPGDIIAIGIAGRPVSYRVDFVNFNPFNNQTQITLGCSPVDAQPGTPAPGDLKEKMDQVVKSDIQIFEKAQAYSNAITLAGYAGIFALWNFAKPSLTERGSSWIIILVGVSLMLYVSWEIVGMITRATAQHRFMALVDKAPGDFFQHLTALEANQRRVGRRLAHLWAVILVPTVVTGYLGALLLIYNSLANIFDWPQWP